MILTTADIDDLCRRTGSALLTPAVKATSNKPPTGRPTPRPTPPAPRAPAGGQRPTTAKPTSGITTKETERRARELIRQAYELVPAEARPREKSPIMRKAAQQQPALSKRIATPPSLTKAIREQQDPTPLTDKVRRQAA